MKKPTERAFSGMMTDPTAFPGAAGNLGFEQIAGLACQKPEASLSWDPSVAAVLDELWWQQWRQAL